MGRCSCSLWCIFLPQRLHSRMLGHCRLRLALPKARHLLRRSDLPGLLQKDHQRSHGSRRYNGVPRHPSTPLPLLGEKRQKLILGNWVRRTSGKHKIRDSMALSLNPESRVLHSLQSGEGVSVRFLEPHSDRMIQTTKQTKRTIRIIIIEFDGFDQHPLA